MKATRTHRLCAAALACALAVTTAHAQTADSQYKFERGYPAAGTAEHAYAAADLRRAVEAYKFFYPTIGTEAVMQQMLAAGAKVNEVGIVMATGPRQQFGGANADTPYAVATVDLKAAGPMVVDLPPGPFIGFVNDHNMRFKRRSSRLFSSAHRVCISPGPSRAGCPSPATRPGRALRRGPVACRLPTELASRGQAAGPAGGMLVASAAQEVHSRRDCGTIAFEIPILILHTSYRQSAVRPARTLGHALARLLDVPALSYWTRRAHLGGHLSKDQRLIGTQRARTVVIDAMLPVLMLYAQHSPDTALREHLLVCYHATPRLPDNHLLRYMHHRMLGNDPALLGLVTGARQQQGLLQLFADFCGNDEGNCQGCDFPLA